MNTSAPSNRQKLADRTLVMTALLSPRIDPNCTIAQVTEFKDLLKRRFPNGISGNELEDVLLVAAHYSEACKARFGRTWQAAAAMRGWQSEVTESILQERGGLGAQTSVDLERTARIEHPQEPLEIEIPVEEQDTQTVEQRV